MQEPDPERPPSLASMMAWVSLAVPVLTILVFLSLKPLRGEGAAPILMSFIFASGCGILAGFGAPLASALEPSPRASATALGLVGGLLNIGMGILLVGIFGFSGLNCR